MDPKLIQTQLRDLLAKLGIQCDDIVVSESAGTTVFTIKTSESGVLIGTNGEALSALNHIFKKMLESSLPEDAHIMVDVNGYHVRKIKSLEEQARLTAERARTFRYDIELSPMSAYERMIVHSTLKGMPDIETTSVGEGKLRHIVIRYKDSNAPAPATDTA